MKNLDLTSMGVRELDTREMQETDGGIIWLVVAGAALLLASCGNSYNIQIGGRDNTITNTQNIDTSFNGNTADSITLSGSLQPIFTPIQK